MRVKRKAPPLVLAFQRGFSQMRRQILDGLSSYARSVGWRLQTVELDCRVLDGPSATPQEVKDLLSFWKPDGCLVECSGRDAPSRAAFGRTPVVFMDAEADLSADVDSLCTDARSIARLAARELLLLGGHDVAYLPWTSASTWSVDRGREFVKVVQANGRRAHVFSGSLDDDDPIVCVRRIADWLEKLPKPCGIFAANDCMGSLALSACARIGLSVPSEIAVVGVDDDGKVCENTPVTLSSVAIDFVDLGYVAAELLAGRLADPRKKPRRMSFGGCHLVRRASSRFTLKSDARVSALLEYIRRHACNGLSAAQAAAQMGSGRRYVDRRFREIVGKSILEEIQDVRIEKVKELLCQRTVSLSALPDFCGYHSLGDLRRVFRRRVGLSLTAYRRANGLESARCLGDSEE